MDTHHARLHELCNRIAGRRCDCRMQHTGSADKVATVALPPTERVIVGNLSINRCTDCGLHRG